MLSPCQHGPEGHFPPWPGFERGRGAPTCMLTVPPLGVALLPVSVCLRDQGVTAESVWLPQVLRGLPLHLGTDL